MLSLQSLQKIAGGLRSTVAEMHKLNDAKNHKIEQFESDKTKSQSYIADSVKKARDETIPKLRNAFASMRDPHALAQAQLEYRSSRALLLSQIPFDPDPAVDALLRTRYAVELAAMDLPLLSLTQRDALDDGNLALAWACEMAARVSGVGGLSDLSEVEIPGQAEALILIHDCDASLAEAELIIGGMEGQSVDPIRKLELGRRMQPNRQTAHNSEGRGVVW